MQNYPVEQLNIPAIRKTAIERGMRFREAWQRIETENKKRIRKRAEEVKNGIFHVGGKKHALDLYNICQRGMHNTIERFRVFPSLARAAELDDDMEATDAAATMLSGWLDYHELKNGSWQQPENSNTLDIGRRLACWMQSIPVFLQFDGFDDDLFRNTVRSTAAQLDYMIDDFTLGGNFRVTESWAVLLSGVVLHCLPDAATWLDIGARQLTSTCAHQVLPDGFHCERTPHYHDSMTRTFTRAWLIQREFDVPSLKIPPNVLAKMQKVSLATKRPNGSSSAIHDSGSFSPDGSRCPGWNEEYMRFCREIGRPDELPSPEQWFSDAGLLFIRRSWDPDATFITFDATTHDGWHSHLSQNAIQLDAFGEPLLVDPGSFSYSYNTKGAYGKSTRAHNTINLNGWNQMTCNPDHSDYVHLNGYDLAISLYGGGYWPGQYQGFFFDGAGDGVCGRHHRTMLWIRGRAIVVIDHVMTAVGTHDLPGMECNWQFARGPVEVDPKARTAHSRYDDANANLLMLFPIVPENAEINVQEGEEIPMRGWIPKSPAPQVSVECDTMPDHFCDLATVLIPHPINERPDVSFTSHAPGNSARGRITLTWGDGSSDTIHFSPRLRSPVNTDDAFKTDSGFIHLQRDARGHLTRGFVADGMYIKPWMADMMENRRAFTFDTTGITAQTSPLSAN